MEKESIGKKAKDLWNRYIEKAKGNLVQWKKAIIAFSMITAIGIGSFVFYQSGFSYQVILNGEEIGFVKEEVIAEEALDIVEKDMAKKYGETAYFDRKLETDRVRGHKEDELDSDKLGEIIAGEIEIYKPASVILVDGQEEVAVDSTEKAEYVLEEVKKPYIRDKDTDKKDDKKDKEDKKDDDKDIQVLEVSFNQEIEILSKDVPVLEILSTDKALMALGTKNDRKETYTVSRGDTAWDISRALNMRTEEIEKANPGKDIEKLQPGDEISLVVPKSLLEVVAVERHKSIEDIDFETEEKDDSSIYRGEKKVESEGKKGKKEVLTDITFINGVETEKEVHKETVIEEPKNKIVLVGTKERPRPVARPAARNTSRNTAASRPAGPAPAYNGSRGSSIVATAMRYLGTPYRYGGSTPAGFDCSGFTSYVYRQHGISLPRTSGGQGSHGAYVSRSQLQPGDIVAFPGHVGIYVGGNQYIHSPQTGDVVKVSSLAGRNLLSGRRPY